MEDTTIWRYLDFTKFLDLISSRLVFFCRSDQLGDPFEGSFPRERVERQIAEIRQHDEEFENELRLYETAGIEFRKYVFVNCWHMSDCESSALWRLYLKSDEGVAIRSTRNRLGAAFANSKPGVWQVPIWYIDYNTDDPPVPTRWAPFRYKRKSFAHEKELRAIVYADVQDEQGNILPPPGEKGIRLDADLDRLIEAVYVAPTAPDWFRELTVRVCRKFEVRAEVIPSSLVTDKPVFL